MRVVIVGRARDRERFKHELADTTLEIVGEAETINEAHAHHGDADAFLIASTGGAVERDTSDVVTPEPLTARELDVLELLAEGLPNKAIATRLGISDQTVKFHVSAICGKLGAANRTDAVRLAIRRGLIAI